MGGGNDAPPYLNRFLVGTDEEFEVERSVTNQPLPAGSVTAYQFGGGGGYGDPLKRDPQAVLDDVLDELVSVEGAARDYGVVLTGSLEDLSLAIDESATARLRAARTSEAGSDRSPLSVGD
jgi:N-methylhydantoinase B